MAVRVRNGKYVVDYYPNGRSGKRVRITLPSGTTEEQARELEKEYRDRPFLFVVYDDTVSNLIGKYYEYVGLARTLSSVRSIQECFDGPLGAYFNPIRVSALTQAQVESYKERRLLEFARPGTINKELSYLSAFIRWAATRLNLHPKAELNIRKLHVRCVSARSANEDGARLYVLKNELVACEQKLPFECGESRAQGRLHSYSLPVAVPSTVHTGTPGREIDDTPSMVAASSSFVAMETFNDDTLGKKVDFSELVIARQKRITALALDEEDAVAEIGELSAYLVGSRRDANVSLMEIVGRTNISPMYLKALEKEEFGKMPGGIFVEGYIREYMKALSMDTSEALAIYYRLSNPKAANQPPALIKKNRGLAYALLTALAILLMAFLFFGAGDIGGIVYEKYRAIMKIVHGSLVYGQDMRPV
jgi:hypothetical protein